MLPTPVPSTSRHPCAGCICMVVPGGLFLRTCFAALGPGSSATNLCSQERFWDLFCNGDNGSSCTWIWVIPLSSHTVVSGVVLWQESALVSPRYPWLADSQVHKSGMFDFILSWACQLWFSKPVALSQAAASPTSALGLCHTLCSLACIKVKLRKGTTAKAGMLTDTRSICSLLSWTEFC